MVSETKRRPNAPLTSGDENLHRRQIAGRANASVLEDGGRIVSLDPIHATDSGTDAFVSVRETDTPLSGFVIMRDFQSASTTTSPTLDAINIKARDGTALSAGDIEGVHMLQYNGTEYRLLF